MTRVCQNCGKPVFGDSRFCEECGSSLPPTAPPPDPEGMPPPEMPPPPPMPAPTPSVPQQIALQRSSGRTATGTIVLILGVAALLLGIAGLVVADHYKPTFENAFANEGDVFSPDTYDAVRAVSWLLMVGGIAGAVVGIVLLSARPQVVMQAPTHLVMPPPPAPPSEAPPPPPPPAAPIPPEVVKPPFAAHCEQCGEEITPTNRFCPECGAPQNTSREQSGTPL